MAVSNVEVRLTDTGYNANAAIVLRPLLGDRVSVCFEKKKSPTDDDDTPEVTIVGLDVTIAELKNALELIETAEFPDEAEAGCLTCGRP